MLLNWYNSALLCTLVVASINIQRGGWLDRLVEYHKRKFYNEVIQLAPIEIDATIQRAPPGYTDSKAWTTDSVMRLLVLISESEKARPVRIALRRMLKPTRRLSMSKQKSYKIFPSLGKNIENYLYYDMDTDEEYVEQESQFIGIPDDDAVVVVTNPVEARLPSAQISVRLLRDILDARAQAARIMPPTTRKAFPWKVLNTSKAAALNDTTLITTPADASDGAGNITVAESIITTSTAPAGNASVAD